MIWVRTDWTKEDLHGKRVDFQVSLADRTLRFGFGELRVSGPNPDGQIAVELIPEKDASQSDPRASDRFWLTPVMVAELARHPNPKVADFLVDAIFPGAK